MSGASAGAIHITSYLRYDLLNVKFSNIDIYNSRCDAIFINSRNEKTIENLRFENINIYGAGRYGVSFNNAIGNASYCNLKFENVEEENLGPVPETFEFRRSSDCPN